MSPRSRTSAAYRGTALLGALLLGGAAPAHAGPPGAGQPPEHAPAPAADPPAAKPAPAKPEANKPAANKPAAAKPGTAEPAASTAGAKDGGSTAAAPASPELLDAVQARYERVQDLRAKFEQRSRVASLGREDSSSGTLAMRRPGRMRWEYSAPETHVLTIDGQTLRMYVPAERQLQIAPLDPSTFSPTALSFLLGEGELAQDFTAEPLPPAASGEVGLRLRPRRESGFEYLELWLEPGALTLRESVLVDLFGNRTSVRFSDVVENAGVPEASFQIDVPPGTEVIDLR